MKINKVEPSNAQHSSEANISCDVSICSAEFTEGCTIPAEEQLDYLTEK